MEFKKINAGGAARPNGTVVQIAGPQTVEYTSGGRVAAMGIDHDPTNRISQVYAEGAVWTDSGARLTGEELESLRSDLREAFGLLEGVFNVC